MGTSLPCIIAEAEAGRFPPPDLGLTVVPPAEDRAAAVVAFTGHVVVAADVPAEWVAGQLPAGDLSAPLNPPFLTALCVRTGGRVNNLDLVCLAPAYHDEAYDDAVPMPLERVADSKHPRVLRARRYRDDVTVWATEGAVLSLGRGLAGRWEASIEVDPAFRGRGIGRRLALTARTLTPGGAPVWAQVAPGNAASVRAFLAAGYRPVGAEALLVRPAPGER